MFDSWLIDARPVHLRVRARKTWRVKSLMLYLSVRLLISDIRRLISDNQILYPVWENPLLLRAYVRVRGPDAKQLEARIQSKPLQ